tara:strand:- start:157 stop:330 length:174 start_codon:yes stop_codon:yes gene_type:complete
MEAAMNYIITIPLYNLEEKEEVLNTLLKSPLLEGKGRRVTIKEVEGSLVTNECEISL